MIIELVDKNDYPYEPQITYFIIFEFYITHENQAL